MSNLLPHRELRISHGVSKVSSVYLPTPRWHHLKAHPFLAIHSADDRRMMHSFPNITSYCTFYDFFSSFRITLWPIWLANSKTKALLLSNIVTRRRRHTELSKNWQPDGKPVLCHRNFSSVFREVVLNCQIAEFNLEGMGAFQTFRSRPLNPFFLRTRSNTIPSSMNWPLLKILQNWSWHAVTGGILPPYPT